MNAKQLRRFAELMGTCDTSQVWLGQQVEAETLEKVLEALPYRHNRWLYDLANILYYDVGRNTYQRDAVTLETRVGDWLNALYQADVAEQNRICEQHPMPVNDPFNNEEWRAVSRRRRERIEEWRQREWPVWKQDFKAQFGAEFNQYFEQWLAESI